MKIKYVYTVEREAEVPFLQKATDLFKVLKDEPGEYLYGGAGGKEKVTVALFTLTPEGHWWRH